jgi:hypothetical protein
MPQIFMMLSPNAQKRLPEDPSEFFKEVATTVGILISQEWSVPTDDIACSVVNLVYTANEADVQIELRYTVGEGLYHEGEMFDPPISMQASLIESMIANIASIFTRHQLLYSVWCKPFTNSRYEWPSTSD